MKKLLIGMLTAVVTGILTTTSCTNEDNPNWPEDVVEAQLSQMTLREK